ncbi:tyrosine-type recombinase/integrase [Terrabacter sp. NPDC000476]|uniref:tyrosine-type recombinase/integrase n=1 Tax=Terrabacter sp. NPDC000476 TaxID=3154258 RepID=UPI00331CA2DA
MGYVVDRWMVRGPSGRKVKGPRYGRGKRWLARWTEPSGASQSKAFPSRDAAEGHLALVDVSKRSGTYVADTRTTFEEHARQWLRHQVHHQPGTAETAERRLRLDAFPAFGATPLPKITRLDVQEMVSAAAERLAPDTVRLTMVYVQAVFDSAVEDRLLAATPCRSINLPSVEHRLVVPLSVAQVLQLHAQAPEHLRRAVLFAAGTGMRPGEWRSVTEDRYSPGMVRLDRQLAAATSSSRVVWGPLKTKASYRTVRLSPTVEKVLLEQLEQGHRGPDGLVFTSYRGGPLRRSQLSYAWDVASAGMGLGEGAGERSGWHDLRHHHASLLIGEGASPRAVADRLGHADPSETMRTYAHLWPSDEARIAAAVEAAYGDLGRPTV